MGRGLVDWRLRIAQVWLGVVLGCFAVAVTFGVVRSFIEGWPDTGYILAVFIVLVVTSWSFWEVLIDKDRGPKCGSHTHTGFDD